MQDSSCCSKVSTTTVTSIMVRPFVIDLSDCNLEILSCELEHKIGIGFQKNEKEL